MIQVYVAIYLWFLSAIRPSNSELNNWNQMRLTHLLVARARARSVSSRSPCTA